MPATVLVVVLGLLVVVLPARGAALVVVDVLVLVEVLLLIVLVVVLVDVLVVLSVVTVVPWQ